MKCPNDALFIKDDHEHYVRCGQAEAEDVAHLMAGETAAGALSTQRSWLVRLSASLFRLSASLYGRRPYCQLEI
jgi:hypothetical protein